MPKRTTLRTWVWGAVLTALFLPALVGYISAKMRTDAIPQSAGAVPPTAAPTGDSQSQPKVKPENWSYDESVDAMRKSKWKSATARSTNTLQFDFPYAMRDDRAYLRVQQEPSGRREVALLVDKGQFLCSGVDGCSISVKFDDGPVRQVHAVTAADGTIDAIFPSYSIVPQIKKSKSVTIEARFYQSGDRQMTFATEGLRWD